MIKLFYVYVKKNITKNCFNFLQNWTWYKNKSKNNYDNWCSRRVGTVWLRNHIALGLRPPSLTSTDHLS